MAGAHPASWGKALYAGVRQDLVAVFPATMQLTVSPNPVLVPGSPALRWRRWRVGLRLSP